MHPGWNGASRTLMAQPCRTAASVVDHRDLFIYDGFPSLKVISGDVVQTVSEKKYPMIGPGSIRDSRATFDLRYEHAFYYEGKKGCIVMTEEEHV